MNDEIIRRDNAAIKQLFKNLKQLERNNQELVDYIKVTINGENYLTSEHMCELLKITHRTLQNYRLKRVIPYTNIGGKYYYPEKGVIEILEKNKIVEVEY